jgi:hypothetical protein
MELSVARQQARKESCERNEEFYQLLNAYPRDVLNTMLWGQEDNSVRLQEQSGVSPGLRRLRERAQELIKAIESDNIYIGKCHRLCPSLANNSNSEMFL